MEGNVKRSPAHCAVAHLMRNGARKYQKWQSQRVKNRIKSEVVIGKYSFGALMQVLHHLQYFLGYARSRILTVLLIWKSPLLLVLE